MHWPNILLEAYVSIKLLFSSFWMANSKELKLFLCFYNNKSRLNYVWEDIKIMFNSGMLTTIQLKMFYFHIPF
jgi:hypothetical protein